MKQNLFVNFVEVNYKILAVCKIDKVSLNDVPLTFKLDIDFFNKLKNS